MTKFTISLKQWTDSKSLVSLYSIYRLLSTQSTTPSYSIASLPGLVYATVLSLGSRSILQILLCLLSRQPLLFTASFLWYSPGLCPGTHSLHHVYYSTQLAH